MTEQERDQLKQDARQVWMEKKTCWEERVRSIVIPVDPTPGIIKVLISQIDSLYTDVRLEYAAIRSDRDALEKRIYVIERKAAGTGKNDQHRRANGVTAVESYEVGEEESVNLWEILNEINQQYEFVSSIIDILESKQNRLITESGILKLEKNIL